LCYNRPMQKKGFTILELSVVLVFATLLVIIFFIQKVNTDAMHRDEKRKESINAMYYALEEGFYNENGYYPEKISEDNLKVMDPQLFTDPRGLNLGTEGSSLVYEPANCENAKCKEFTLRAVLEKEDTFIKKNREHKK